MSGNQPKLQNLGPLKVLKYGSDSDSASKVIIFHGFGANAHDLYSLGEAMDPKGEMQWYFPDGVLAVPIAPGFMGKAWFPIDTSALEKAMVTGEGVNYSGLRPRGMDEAVNRALEFLQAVNFEPSNGFLGGFSQGSMMAVDIVKNLPEPPKGLLVYSGALVDQQGFAGKDKGFKNLNVFQSHGQQDPVLPFTGAENLKRQLQKMGATVQWSPFFGGHEIPFEVISQSQKIFRQGHS